MTRETVELRAQLDRVTAESVEMLKARDERIAELVSKRDEARSQLAHLRKHGCYPANDGQTHYEGCWQTRGHHECAKGEVDRLKKLGAIQAAKERLNG